MQISSNIAPSLNQTQSSSGIKTLYTEKLTQDELKDIKAQLQANANAYAFDSAGVQSATQNKPENFLDQYNGFQSFLQDIGYDGKPIAELSQEEASALVSEDGIFGIKQTSERIAQFVIAGAGGDEDLLRAGREGMLKGFKEAENMLGGQLPDISQKTIQAATEMVDKEMARLGYSILDQEA